MSCFAKLTISSLAIKTTIGVFPFERQLKQTLLIDLTLCLDITQAALTDNIIDAINYDDVAKLLQKTAEETSYHLIEALAAHLQKVIIETYPQVEAGSLILHKKGAVSQAHGVSIALEWRK